MKSRSLLSLFLIFYFTVLPTHAQDATLTPLPVLEPITAENAGQVQQLGILGHGLIFDIAWSPDGKIVAVASSTGVILLDSEKMESAPYQRLPIAEDFTVAVAFSPDGKLLATFSRPNYDSQSTQAVARLWNRNDGTVVAQWSLDIGSVFDMKAAFSPDANIVALYTENNADRWDIHDRSHIEMLPNESWAAIQHEWYAPNSADLVPRQDQIFAVYSLDGKLAAIEINDGITHLWDLTQRKEIETIPAYGNTLAISPNNKLLVWQQGEEGYSALHVWDIDADEEVFNHDYPMTSRSPQ